MPTEISHVQGGGKRSGTTQKNEWISNKNKTNTESCVWQVLVSDITRTKCAEDLFLGIALLAWDAHVRLMLQLGYLASLNSSSLTRLSCWRSCIVSAPYVNLARPLPPIRHVKLNHCGILISLWEQQPRCRRWNEWCIAWRPYCHVICPFDHFSMNVTSIVLRLSGLCCWWTTADGQH